MIGKPKKTEEDQRRDALLKRMLDTPHKPHGPAAKKKIGRKPKKRQKD